MKKRVMVLMHTDLIPPESIKGMNMDKVNWKTEYDVLKSLREIGHEVLAVGVDDDLSVLRRALDDFKPHVVYNLLVEFQSLSIYGQNIVSYLELKKVAYTGCNPRGLILAQDKALSKKILSYHRIPVPKFFVVQKGHKVRLPGQTQFPLIVKSLIEEASLGISQASIVKTIEQLTDRVKFIHENIETDAIVEAYIDGREFYVGILGNHRLQVFPVWELSLKGLPDHAEPIATSQVKWNEKYRKLHRISSKEATDLSSEQAGAIQNICKRVYRTLGLNGYARIDIRYTNDGKIFVLEANPNPAIAKGDEFQDAAKKMDISYNSLNQKILSLAQSWHEKRL